MSIRSLMLVALSRVFRRLNLYVDAHLRRITTSEATLPELISHDGSTRLAVSVQKRTSPWSSVVLGPDHIPGMISEEERRYYGYIGQFYSGIGEAVELGPWLGRSTSFIVGGLQGNPNFEKKKLFVYDDFVWRPSWMNPHIPEADRMGEGADFRELFDKYTHPFSDQIQAERRAISPQADNAHVPPLTWDGSPIEFLIVDCGREFSVNNNWYNLFSPYFIPDKTLVVMQDWRLHREVPVQWYNQTKEFTDSKGEALQLVHEVRSGGIATFLFRG